MTLFIDSMSHQNRRKVKAIYCHVCILGDERYYERADRHLLIPEICDCIDFSMTHAIAIVMDPRF